MSRPAISLRNSYLIAPRGRFAPGEAKRTSSFIVRRDLLASRAPRLPAPRLFAFLFWVFANRFCRLSDRWFRHLHFDVAFFRGITATDANLILVHVVFHRLQELQKKRSSEGFRGLHRSLYYRLLCLLEKRIYRRNELRLAAVSTHAARQLAHYFGRRDAVVAPNGDDLSFFSPASRLALWDAIHGLLSGLEPET